MRMKQNLKRVQLTGRYDCPCSESVAIKRENVHLKDGFVKLEVVVTKTRRARLVPLSIRTIDILKAYLNETKKFPNEYF